MKTSKIGQFFTSLWESITHYVSGHKKLSIVIASVLVVCIILIIVLPGGGDQDQTVQTQVVTLYTGNFSETIDVVGNVNAIPSAALTWGTGGTVGKVFYEIGDSVEAGDVIAVLADSSVSASILQAQTDLLEARYELDRVRTSDTEFQEAAQALEDAEYDYRAKRDSRDYWNFNGTNQDTLDEARQQYHDLDDQVWNLQDQFDAMASDDPARENASTELQDTILQRDKALRNLNYLLGHAYDHSVETDYIEFELAEAALQEARITYQRYLDNSDEIAAAQAKVQALENTVNSASIIAPFDGVITSIAMNEGESVSSGEKAVQIDDLTNLVIKISISEVDVNDIQLGQNVMITFDAIPQKEYQGLVTNISQSGDDSSGIVEFLVAITVSDPDEDIKPGFTALTSIIIKEEENAVLIPNLAIQSLNGNSIIMVVNDDGSITPTPVEVEASGDSFSILKDSALKEGDQVLIELDVTSLSDFSAFGGGMMFGGGGMGGSRPDQQLPAQ